MAHLNCANCPVRACSDEPGSKAYPRFCPMAQDADALKEARAAYEDPATQKLALAAAQTEADRYPLEPRVEEVMSFARRIGAQRLGIASCVGLIQEASVLQDIFEAHGFQVDSVCCKVGSIPKEEIGLADKEKIHPGQYEALCSPIGQAKLLDEAGSELVPTYAARELAKGVPKHRMNEEGMAPRLAYQVIHDELRLDGFSRRRLGIAILQPVSCDLAGVEAGEEIEEQPFDAAVFPAG